MSKIPQKFLVDSNIALKTQTSIRNILSDPDLVANIHPADVAALNEFVEEMDFKRMSLINRMMYEPTKKGLNQ